MADEERVPLSPAQRSRIRRLSKWKEPDPGEEAGELNIVPYLDIVMNIIVFVIATISVVFVTTIDTQAPASGGKSQTRKMQSKALNLNAFVTKRGISLKTAVGSVAPGCESYATTATADITIPRKSDGGHNFDELRRCARFIKSQNESFAEERQVTLVPNPDVEFQVIIGIMDALRLDDAQQCTKDEKGMFNGPGCLFPDVLFGVPR